jgi:hypothetical protein
MRRTGQVMEWPLKIAASAFRRLGRIENPNSQETVSEKPVQQLEADLLTAATYLHQNALADPVTFGETRVETPPVARRNQDRLRQKDWKTILTHIRGQQESILSWSDQLGADLTELALRLRRRMGFMGRFRQTVAALLNVLPATAAITYVLSTGDPVGATGIKVKLTGLLGLKDLYALIAIPATAGLKKADQRQLEMLLAPVARTWLEHKFVQIQTLFEEQISGEMLNDLRNVQSRSTELLERLDKVLTEVEGSGIC